MKKIGRYILGGIAALALAGYFGNNWIKSDRMIDNYISPKSVFAAEKRKFIQETKKEDAKQSLETTLQIFSDKFGQKLRNGNISNSANELMEIRQIYNANTENNQVE
jgi:hypothetical protein